MNVVGISKVVKAFAIGVVLCCSVMGCNEIIPLSPVETEQGITGVTANKASVQVTAQDVSQINEQLEALSRATAIALADPAMVEILHAQVLKRFDGDTDVLWDQLDADDAVSKGNVRGWSSLIFSKLDSKGVRSIPSSQEVERLLARAEKAMGGKLHLYWYHPEKWDRKTTPLVAYTPVDEKLGKRKDAPAFDAAGTSYIVTEEIAKTRPVIILTRNERTDAEGKLKKSAPQSIIGGLNNKNSSVQNTYIRLRLESFSVPSSYEDFLSGGPEFVAHFRTTQDGNSVSEYPGWNLTGITAAECDGRIITNWVNEWERSFYWDSVTHKTLYIKWTEEDPKPIFSGSASLSITGEFKLFDFTIKPNVNFTITIPDRSVEELQGWSINNDHPAYPYAPLRSYNGGNPSTVVRFDP
jgi:hypothetical protein